MAFFNGEGIDLPTITKLAEAGLSLNGMATITGHSKTGIKRALERNKIPFATHVRERFVVVDCLMTSSQTVVRASPPLTIFVLLLK